MSQSPVPVPAPISPPGGPADPAVPAWTAADAAAWSGARAAAWARPLWAVLALLVPLVAAMAAAPVPVCSDAAPCGPDWFGMAQTGLALALLYWNARLPELVLVAAPVLALVVAWEQFPAADWQAGAADTAVLAALAFGWASARERLAARRRQRLLVERAAVPVALPAEAPGGPRRPGTVACCVGLALVAVAAGAVVLALRGIDEGERRTERATRAEARVTGHTDLVVKVRTADGRAFGVDAVFPEDYRAGTVVTVLEDASGRWLAAEPYDPVGWQLLTLATGLPGVSLLAGGALARRRHSALRAGPVPALRVAVRLGHDGSLRVHPADDPAGRAPLFSCAVAPVAVLAEDHRRGVPERPAEDRYAGLREAVLLGAPYEDAELVFVMTGWGGDPVTARTVSPVRLRPPSWATTPAQAPAPASTGR
ncbi:hypothetical protein [Streptomyces sp. NPDC048659]|uniref:hypothetical protein n=1 Tax=Streptomyces sp. NPDC048659 TaxID=3155489 RepID=UPI00343CC22B